MPLRQFSPCNAGAIHRGLKIDIAGGPCQKRKSPRRHQALNLGNDHKRSVGPQGREVHFLLINRQAFKKNGTAGFIAAPFAFHLGDSSR